MSKINPLYSVIAIELMGMVNSQFSSLSLDPEDFKAAVTDGYHHGDVADLNSLILNGVEGVELNLEGEIEQYSLAEHEVHFSLKTPDKYLNDTYAHYFDSKSAEAKAGGFVEIQAIVYYRAVQWMMRDLLKKVCESVELNAQDKGVDFYEMTPDEIKDAVAAYLDDLNLVVVAFEV